MLILLDGLGEKQTNTDEQKGEAENPFQSRQTIQTVCPFLIGQKRVHNYE
ncbi:hypothetical protein [uncultured Algoriphagus sp.]|nr:hypothetical protein [uncultured Algoriphagus sp.]